MDGNCLNIEGVVESGKSVLKGSSNQVSLSSWLTEVGKTG